MPVQLCVDCLSANPRNPMPREGKSPRCADHKEQRRQWGERQRQRRTGQQHYRRQKLQAQRGEVPQPKPPIPEEYTFTPNALHLPAIPGLTLTQQQTRQLKSIMKLIDNTNIEASDALRKGSIKEQAALVDEFLEHTTTLHRILRRPLAR